MKKEKTEEVERELPEFFCVLGVGLDEAVNLTVFAFKEFMKPYKNYGFLNVQKGQAKYYRIFMGLSANICITIYELYPKIRLKNFEYVKICLDYFGALRDDYQKRNLMFHLNQIHTVYAMEVFQDWCIKKFRSMKRYLELALYSPQRDNSLIEELKEPEMKEFKKNKKAIVEREIRGVKGLSEIIF